MTVDHGDMAAPFADTGVGGRSAPLAARIAELTRATAPGARIGYKHEIRQQCGGTVAAFNEALRLLQSRGEIVARPGPGGGLFAPEVGAAAPRSTGVLPASGTGMSSTEAVRMRAAIEPLVLEDAVRHASPAALGGLCATLARAADAVVGRDVQRFIEIDRDLHLALADFSPHPLVRTVYRLVLAALAADRPAMTLLCRNSAAHLQWRHELQVALVDALIRRDLRAAVETLRHHRVEERELRTPG